MTAFLKSIRPGGLLAVLSEFNDDPVDVVIRHRRTDLQDAKWEGGWNIFSCDGAERLLARKIPGAKLSWHPFRMPFELQRREDPMRSWTVAMADNPYQTVNGACQILPQKVLLIHLPTKMPSSL
jgi:hypothetical protein